MNAGALFAAGWAIALVGLAALRSGQLPKVLSALMLLAGISMLLSFALLSIGLIGVVLAPIWSAWLGFLLLSNRVSKRNAAQFAVAA